MRCPSESRKSKAVLLSYVAGRLAADDALRFRAHLQTCATCGLEVRAQSDVWAALDHWEPAEISEGFDRRLRAQIETCRPMSFGEKAAEFLAGWIGRPAPALAVLSVALLGGVYVAQRTPAIPIEKASSAIATPVSPADAEQINSAFDDLQLLHQLDVKDEAPDASQSM